jgi:hypothetical protein
MTRKPLGSLNDKPAGHSPYLEQLRQRLIQRFRDSGLTVVEKAGLDGPTFKVNFVARAPSRAKPPEK